MLFFVQRMVFNFAECNTICECNKCISNLDERLKYNKKLCCLNNYNTKQCNNRNNDIVWCILSMDSSDDYN